MRTDRNIHDKLNVPAHLYYQPRALKLYDMPPDVAKLNLIAARHELIQYAKLHPHKLRTWANTRIYHMDTDPNVVDIDNIEQMRLRGFEIVESYTTDDYGDNSVRAFIAQLPGKNREERWIYGYNYSDWDGATVFLTVCAKEDAVRYAKEMAFREAEQCYDNWREDKRQQKILDLKDNLRVLRKLIRAQIKACKVVKNDLLKDILRAKLDQRRQLLNELRGV